MAQALNLIVLQSNRATPDDCIGGPLAEARQIGRNDRSSANRSAQPVEVQRPFGGVGQVLLGKPGELHFPFGQVAPVSCSISLCHQDEGAPGPSLLGTGERGPDSR